VWTNDPY